MQAGWIKIDKEAPSGPLVRRTKDDIDDSVQEALKKDLSLEDRRRRREIAGRFEEEKTRRRSGN